MLTAKDHTRSGRCDSKPTAEPVWEGTAPTPAPAPVLKALVKTVFQKSVLTWSSLSFSLSANRCGPGQCCGHQCPTSRLSPPPHAYRPTIPTQPAPCLSKGTIFLSKCTPSFYAPFPLLKHGGLLLLQRPPPLRPSSHVCLDQPGVCTPSIPALGKRRQMDL